MLAPKQKLAEHCINRFLFVLTSLEADVAKVPQMKNVTWANILLETELFLLLSTLERADVKNKHSAKGLDLRLLDRWQVLMIS